MRKPFVCFQEITVISFGTGDCFFTFAFCNRYSCCPFLLESPSFIFRILLSMRFSNSSSPLNVARKALSISLDFNLSFSDGNTSFLRLSISFQRDSISFCEVMLNISSIKDEVFISPYFHAMFRCITDAFLGRYQIPVRRRCAIDSYQKNSRPYLSTRSTIFFSNFGGRYASS